jgi:hypothetical protein
LVVGYGTMVAAASSDGASMAAGSGDGAARSYDGVSIGVKKLHRRVLGRREGRGATMA